MGRGERPPRRKSSPRRKSPHTRSTIMGPKRGRSKSKSGRSKSKSGRSKSKATRIAKMVKPGVKAAARKKSNKSVDIDKLD